MHLFGWRDYSVSYRRAAPILGNGVLLPHLSNEPFFMENRKMTDQNASTNFSDSPSEQKSASRFGTVPKVIIVLAIIFVSCKVGWEWASRDFNNARPFIEAMAYDKGYKDGYQTASQGLPPAR
jgi:hypothetical protein